MATIEMVMPQMGESIIEGTILTWLKKEGDTIEQDESVLEVATDKVDTEVPALHGGILKKILAKEGEVIAVGAPIAIIETDEVQKEEEAYIKSKAVSPPERLTSAQPETENSPSPVSLNLEDNRFYSPLVRNMAKEEGISKTEMAAIPGTGKSGRVTKQDMINYLMAREYQKGGENLGDHSKTNASDPAEDEIIQMDRMRIMISQRMLESKNISAHVTSFVEADVTN